MSFSLIADFSADRLVDLDPEFFKSKGISFVLLDLDNTLSPYGTLEPEPEVIRWREDMAEGGIELFFVSNSKKQRPVIFSEKLDIPYIMRARKPSPRGIYEALKRTGHKKEETVLIGDQIYTDTLAANLAGVRMILVRPIKFSNIFLALRYGLELPFRALTRERLDKGGRG